MKITEREFSNFKAIVKALGVYHLILGASGLYRIRVDKSGIALLSVSELQHQGEHIAWAIFEFAVALALLYGTDAFCRLAFSRGALEERNRGDAP